MLLEGDSTSMLCRVPPRFRLYTDLKRYNDKVSAKVRKFGKQGVAGIGHVSRG